MANPTIPRDERLCSCNTCVQSLHHVLFDCLLIEDLHEEYQFTSIEEAMNRGDLTQFLLKMERKLGINSISWLLVYCVVISQLNWLNLFCFVFYEDTVFKTRVYNARTLPNQINCFFQCFYILFNYDSEMILFLYYLAMSINHTYIHTQEQDYLQRYENMKSWTI